MANSDLSALDRSTLRAWRVLNLVGWAVAGLAANVLLLASLGLISARATMALSVPFGYVAGAAALAVAGAVAGTVVGAHVYRSPGAVAGIATSVLGMFFALVFIPWPYLGGIALLAAIFSIDVVAAIVAARRRWRRRPAALRAASVI